LSKDYRGKKIVVYPQYIDSTKSRSNGRRIPLKDALPHPSIEEIVEAADKLGLNPLLEEDKKYPREWWSSTGRVIVDKRGSKLETLRLIARKIREIRGITSQRA
jgi:signal recognition particle subunit SRP19